MKGQKKWLNNTTITYTPGPDQETQDYISAFLEMMLSCWLFWAKTFITCGGTQLSCFKAGVRTGVSKVKAGKGCLKCVTSPLAIEWESSVTLKELWVELLLLHTQRKTPSAEIAWVVSWIARRCFPCKAFFWHVPPERGPREDLWQAGVTMSLGWLGNGSSSGRKVCLSQAQAAAPVTRTQISGRRWMDGWMDHYNLLELIRLFPHIINLLTWTKLFSLLTFTKSSKHAHNW